jgi:fructosamine-3-kinase
MAERLRERLTPLVHNGIITEVEIDKIANDMHNRKAAKTLSYLHLDMRRINMIYNNGDIFILDAENCEFGDPLTELATIDVGGEADLSLINGYKNIDGNIDLNSELYHYYKMERQALVLHLFMNIVKNDTNSTQRYLESFYEIKDKILNNA